MKNNNTNSMRKKYLINLNIIKVQCAARKHCLLPVYAKRVDMIMQELMLNKFVRQNDRVNMDHGWYACHYKKDSAFTKGRG